MSRRLEYVILASIIISLCSGIAYAIAVWTEDRAPLPSLGTYSSPHEIVGIYKDERVILGAQPRVGDILIVRGQHCINSRKEIQVLTWRTFTNVNTTQERNGRAAVVSGATRLQERRQLDDSCEPTDLMVALPAGLYAGRWRLNAFDLSQADGVIRSWETVEFEVSP